MPAVLNTNVASLWASKNLMVSQDKMANSVERLSSGLRINRARDDAAGLGISQSLAAQVNGANQGVRNLNDGISMTQTAEGAIAAATEMGQRILMLATQAANAPLGSNERTSVKNEMQRLIDSIDSISTRTKFAGNSLLAATASQNGTDLFKIQVSNVATDTLNLQADAFRNIGGKTSTSYPLAVANDFSSLAVGTHKIYINASPVSGGTRFQAFDLEVLSTTGTRTYRIKDDADGSLAIAEGVAGTAVKTLQTGAGAAFSVVGDTTAGYVDFDITKTLTGTSVGVATGKASALSTAIDATDTTDANTFRLVQIEAQSYVDSLVSQRGLLGAYQNQMEYTATNVTELSGNLAAAKSRVIDTDYAAETANLTKGQILQQAATAMLAQANQMPNVILTLLK
jgi:flagellin